MQFVWFKKSFDALNVSILALNNGVPYYIAGSFIDQGIRYSRTIGSYITYKIDKLDLGGNIYYQGGTDPAGNNINAYEALIETAYALSSGTKLGLSYEILSGTDLTVTNVNNSFTPLYGTPKCRSNDPLYLANKRS